MNAISDDKRHALTEVLETLAGEPGEIIDIVFSFNLVHLPEWVKPYFRERAQQPEAIPAGKNSMVQAMRKLADCWILSGKNASGADCPLNRNVHWTGPGFPVSLKSQYDRISTSLLAYGRGEEPGEEMLRNGKLRPVQHPPLLENALLDPSYTWEDALRIHGGRLARFQFKFLLDSPYSYHLACCYGCKGYFAYERKPRRKISRGVFCKNCKASASLVRTQASRQDERKNLLALAVESWPQWTSRKHPSRALWIAMRVNEKRKGTERRITQKWVSRNLDIRTGKVKKRSAHERL
jgi:hypothetical protein